MKSIKPGRGNSAMGVVVGVFVTIFGVFWTITASSMGAPIIFPIFGIGFIIIAGLGVFMNYKNATGKNRYSVFDITEDGEEIDPLEARFGKRKSREINDIINSIDDNKANHIDKNKMKFCPYCGESINSEFDYCMSCGKRLPK